MATAEEIADEEYSAVVTKHCPQIFRFLLSSTRDVDLGETLTQECFLKAHRNWGRFRGESSAMTWLMRIAINSQMDHWRNRTTLEIDSTTRIRLLRRLYALLAFSLMTFQMLAVLCALAQPAYAYVDPGSGLMAFQIISSTFAGMIFLLRRRLHRLLMRTIRHFGSKDKEGPEQ